ncbi:MAG: MBOAT family protein [Oscillospiraceae bacterium]|nr:MBOAT family protein [Oscillospiraceae bacterium]MDD3832341.1 MBOAT family protein [Oscillospiraceae bacterium]MDD4546619.1 MBOAT family protein [Oscillospiraceae bacterium]
MVFSSILFLFYFLPAVLLLYFIAPKKLKNPILLIFSLFFYAWGEPVYVLIMISVIIINYLYGLWIERLMKKGRPEAARFWLILCLIINLGILGFYKYADFFIENLNIIPSVSIPLLGLSLPIGVSFFTFQSLSYTIDVYRGIVTAQPNIISLGTYVALFPQLIAGPIVQYKTIDKQLDNRTHSFDKFGDGVRRFITGLGKKVLLANTVGVIWDKVSALDTATLPALTAWIGILAFTFQIYFDFSGYSDMAIGLGKMFGFEFLENFDYPYISKSITAFWRRWHISLGTWFREYVYIPLGGNRKGLPLQLRNILIVWLLTGIWHGASWNFVVWGLYFGILLALEKLFLLKFLNKAPSIITHLYTMFLVVISWVIFASDNLSKGISYLGAMFGANGAPAFDNSSIYLLITNALLFIIAAIGCTDYPKRLTMRVEKVFIKKPALSTLVGCVVLLGISGLCVAYLVDASYNPFLYFRF